MAYAPSYSPPMTYAAPAYSPPVTYAQGLLICTLQHFFFLDFNTCTSRHWNGMEPRSQATRSPYRVSESVHECCPAGVLGLGVLQFCWPLMYALAISLCAQLLCIQAARLSPPHHIRTLRPQQQQCTDRDRATALNTALNTAHLNTPPGWRTVPNTPPTPPGRRTVLRSRNWRPDMGRDTVDCAACEAGCAQMRFSNHRIVRRLSNLTELY